MTIVPIGKQLDGVCAIGCGSYAYVDATGQLGIILELLTSTN